MKKVLFIAMLVMANSIMLSCSADDVEGSKAAKTDVKADGGGDTPIPPPKPPRT